MDFLLSAYSFVVGTIVPFLFVLTIVVFFHELGHFAVARWCNVKVVAFSVGFGRELLGWTDRQGTRWKLCLIPLGGYVKFAGDENAASVPNRERIAQMSEEERRTAFIAKPVWQRASVVAAGPIANFLLAIVIFTSLFMFYGKQGWIPMASQIVEGGAADEAGLEAGDIVRKIDGREILTFGQLYQVVIMSPNVPLQFDVQRGDELLHLTVTPRSEMKTDPFGNPIEGGHIGFAPPPNEEQYRVRKTYNLVEALNEGVQETGSIISTTAAYVWRVITLKQSAEHLGGPIRVAEVSGQAASIGIGSLVWLSAVLSVSIGLINLAPVPILDGGHLLFYAAEAIRGKPLGEKVQDTGFRIGLALILMLMVFVNWIDISRLVSRFSDNPAVSSDIDATSSD
jgi:regulator of sigma E protease